MTEGNERLKNIYFQGILQVFSTRQTYLILNAKSEGGQFQGLTKKAS